MTERIRVLHVDDDPDFADLAARLVERADDRIEVEHVGCPAEARARLAEGDLDCVVSDYDLPGTDGIELLEAARARDPGLPFVLLTGTALGAVAEEALAAGATDVRSKGAGNEQFALLAHRIVQAVERRRAETGVGGTGAAPDETAGSHAAPEAGDRGADDASGTSGRGSATGRDDGIEAGPVGGDDSPGTASGDGQRRADDGASGAARERDGGEDADRGRVAVDRNGGATAQSAAAESDPGVQRGPGDRAGERVERERDANGSAAVTGANGATGANAAEATDAGGTDATDAGGAGATGTGGTDASDADGPTGGTGADGAARTAGTDADAAARPAGSRIGGTHDLLRNVVEQVPTHLYVKDREARHLWVSGHYVDETEGVPDAADHVGKTDLELYPEEFSRETYEDDRRVIETGEPIVDKEEYEPAAGEWNLTTKVPWYGDDGEVLGLIGVSRRITTRKEYEQRLERQNERLDEFARVVSHDLRNPLTVARGNLELAREESEPEHLETVESALDRMASLIDDLLDLARHGERAVDPEPVSLRHVAERAWATVETGEATLSVEADPTVAADPGHLRQLLENLYRNAVEHCPDDVAVTVGALPAGFYVADDGPGIPEEEREAVLESGFSTTEPGTGLGLSIVRDAARAHGWELELAESAAGGARFEFTGVEAGEEPDVEAVGE